MNGTTSEADLQIALAASMEDPMQQFGAGGPAGSQLDEDA